jgi:hypothetical protein
LLLRPPTLWVTLQGLLLVALLLWQHGPRFGGLRPAAAASRRSKEEFLDALATLLQRKGDFAEAFRTARDGLCAEMERAFGLPPGLPSRRLAAEAEARRGVRPGDLLPLLEAAGPPGGPGEAAFVKALNQLEALRDELIPRRPDRPPE